MLFRDLSLQERAMYHAIVKSKNKETNQFFHRIDKLAYRAGLDHKSAVYAIRGLIDKEIISRESRPGHSSLYTFLKDLPLEDETASDNVFATTRSVQVSHQQPVAQSHHITTGFKQSNLTTTEWLNENLLKTLTAKYGSQAVEDRVVVISKLNGKIGNKTGLLVASLKGNYIPASKELREAEERQRITLAIEAKRQKLSQEYEKMIQDRETSLETINLVSEFDKLIAENAKGN